MQRILHIVGGMDRAGAETMIMNLYRNIDRTQFQFDFLYFMNKKCDYDDEIIALGGQIYHLPNSNPITRTIDVFKFLKNNKQFQIVHSHTLLNSGFNLVAAYFAGVKNRIAHAHSTTNSNVNLVGKFYEKICKFLIKIATTKRIACGKEAADFLFNKDKVTILYNGIDVDSYAEITKENKSYVRDLFKINASTKIFIQVGRLLEVKNHLFSFDLMKQLKEQNVDFKFLVVGQGVLEDKLKKQVKTLGLADEVIFTGIREDVPQLMAGSDIMLMPSLYEGFPVVLVESQAVGLPSLISENIAKEVDLNLNLIDFLPLDKMDDWVVSCNKYYDKNINSEVLKNKGFDVKSNVKNLEKIYKQMI